MILYIIIVFHIQMQNIISKSMKHIVLKYYHICLHCISDYTCTKKPHDASSLSLDPPFSRFPPPPPSPLPWPPPPSPCSPTSPHIKAYLTPAVTPNVTAIPSLPRHVLRLPLSSIVPHSVEIGVGICSDIGDKYSRQQHKNQ